MASKVTPAEVTVTAPGAQIVNAQALAQLAKVTAYDVRPANTSMEAVAGSCLPNIIVMGDANNQYTVKDYTNNAMCSASEVDTVGMPVFLVEEESIICCRCCCSGMQPLYAKVYNAAGPPTVGESKCAGKCYMGHQYSRTDEVVMTLERDGCNCTRKWLGPGCCVACMCCQEDMYIHAGDPAPVTKPEELGCCKCSSIEWGGKGKPGATQPVVGHFARLLAPCGGGGCHPELDVYTSDPNNPVGVIAGPPCMKGCMDLFCDSVFTFSTDRSSANRGNIGAITRPKPKDAYTCCIRTCTTIDFYSIVFTDSYVKADNATKAAYLSSVIMLDFMFFENDRPMCDIDTKGDTIWITLTLAYAYCYGCQIPVQCCIPCREEICDQFL